MKAGNYSWTGILKVVLTSVVLLIILKLQWNSFKDGRVKKKLLESRFIQKCDPDDAICKHCPFFQERIHKMFDCVRDRLTKALSSDDLGTFDDAILAAPKYCNMDWLREQRTVQLISLGKTMLSLTPSNLNAPMTALVIGHDRTFLLERQLALNISSVKYYGVNFGSDKVKEDFVDTLNGTVLPDEINTIPEKIESEGTIADQFFQRFFPTRPVDVVFLNSQSSHLFINQLLGQGTHGLAIPICQLNFRLPLPKSVSDMKAFTRWLKDLAVSFRPKFTQFILGHTAISERKGQKSLQAYVVNVGHPICVARFLQKRECRALIATEFDE
ncbi:unnamed protein product [Bursaphelenchus xylophilus]|uniref:(pine wood nematode) hypothetical protein n=1 Tax=Bursaphelenchus xylophilus TaxID=6326 RepID=A0A811LU61_BURXY|nr:unnamed protein product [Bursaphelenchus xylophilus]CAG9122764.1 unnamed protein product [Bursaphelenchus xylophilus]